MQKAFLSGCLGFLVAAVLSLLLLATLLSAATSLVSGGGGNGAGGGCGLAPSGTPSSSQQTPTTGTICIPPTGVAAAVVALAIQMANHLMVNPACGSVRSFPDCYYTYYDSGFPAAVIAYGNAVCPGCAAWSNGQYQCVSFVRGAYSQAYPMNWTANAFDLWALYASKPGWMEVPAMATSNPAQRGMPLPGDAVIMRDNSVGHVAIIVGVSTPNAQGDRDVRIANANSVTPYDHFTVHKDLSADRPPGWGASYVIWGYLRPAIQVAPGGGDLPNSPYVQIAEQDALQAGIPPDFFARQINQESGFNPNALSPAGAEGIAQFMPETARGLGVNPWDPLASLRAAAQLMARYTQTYGGDYAKALAAYNWGSANLQQDLDRYGTNWMNHLPAETRQYIHAIMGI